MGALRNISASRVICQGWLPKGILTLGENEWYAVSAGTGAEVVE
jgi:hypothetical protein